MHIVKTSLRNFSAAHRLVKGYRGKCQNLHGHDYAVNVSFAAEKLNEVGFVVDFLDIKKYCNQWIQENWDHGILLCGEDQALLEFADTEKQKYFILPNNKNTTCEALAEFLFHQLSETAKQHNYFSNPHARLIQVELWESRDSCSIFGESSSISQGVMCGK